MTGDWEQTLTSIDIWKGVSDNYKCNPIYIICVLLVFGSCAFVRVVGVRPPPPPFKAYLAFHRFVSGISPLLSTNMGDNNSVYTKAESDAHHRRGYQACDPCRKRKVKCDLGSMGPFLFLFLVLWPD